MNEEKQQKEKQYFSDIKVGDRVWSITNGWGTVDEITNSEAHPIRVGFDNNLMSTYTYSGKLHIMNVFQSLFWDEIKITPPPKPKRKIKKEGWINVYSHYGGYEGGMIHSTQEIAIQKASNMSIAIIKIEWEEYE